MTAQEKLTASTEELKYMKFTLSELFNTHFKQLIVYMFLKRETAQSLEYR